MAPETTVLPPLPYEIAEDIFLRLPVKSVASSRCVSPAWNKFLSSAAFADRYNAVAAARAAPAFVTLSDETFRRVFCGAGKACHGAVLVGWPSEGEFYLCNPSSGDALLLPPRRHPPWVIFCAGLGYDACARKHKVVLLEELGGLEQRWCKQLQCSVVTVGAGHWRWRAPRGRDKAPLVSKGEIVSTKADPVFADGHLHWMLTAHGDHVGIISFTLGGESFRRLPLPPPFATDNSKPVLGTLGEPDGHLCVLRDLRRRREAVALFELWMLGDLFKPNSSWSLEHRIDLTPHVGKELKSAWDGEFFVVCNVIDGVSSSESNKILMATTDRRAYVYAPNTGELRCVARRNKAHVLYQESLVHLQGMEYGNKHIKFRSTGPLTRASKRLCLCVIDDD
ncbi:hypothetical protein QOZ80_4AG0321270 [Eleusine coracana subsp. coracana]|nr:hypothetical protein QOZ80_4AG0321270 [Eleusine coracana subsp. coracana]